MENGTILAIAASAEISISIIIILLCDVALGKQMNCTCRDHSLGFWFCFVLILRYSRLRWNRKSEIENPARRWEKNTESSGCRSIGREKTNWQKER